MIHKAGFHPTAVLGAMGAAAAAAVALGFTEKTIRRCARYCGLHGRRHHRVPRRRHLDQAHAPGLGGAIGHPRRRPRALAASSGRAPCSRASTASTTASRAPPSGALGQAARRLRQALGHGHDRLQALSLRHHDASVHRLRAAAWQRKCGSKNIEEIVCEAAEGTLHRLWEPLAAKQRPPNAYAGKFSTPYCIAAGFVLGNAGLDAFTEERVRDPRLRALAARCATRSIPTTRIPNEYTGHVRVRMKDGSVLEERQPHHARRRARAAVARRRRGQVPAQLRLRRLERGQADQLPRLGEGRFDAAASSLSSFPGLRNPIRASSVASGASAISAWPDDGDLHGLRAGDLLLQAPWRARRRHHVAPAEDEQRRAFHLCGAFQAGGVVVAGLEVGVEHAGREPLEPRERIAVHPHARDSDCRRAAPARAWPQMVSMSNAL